MRSLRCFGYLSRSLILRIALLIFCKGIKTVSIDIMSPHHLHLYLPTLLQTCTFDRVATRPTQFRHFSQHARRTISTGVRRVSKAKEEMRRAEAPLQSVLQLQQDVRIHPPIGIAGRHQPRARCSPKTTSRQQHLGDDHKMA